MCKMICFLFSLVFHNCSSSLQRNQRNIEKGQKIIITENLFPDSHIMNGMQKQKLRRSWLNAFGTIKKTYTGLHTNKQIAGHKLYLNLLAVIENTQY